MANKVNKTTVCRSPALGVKMAAPAAIMVATTKAVMSKKEEEEDQQKIVVAELKSELEAERRLVRQLRRDKDAEVLKVRHEEQTKLSIALKDQSKKLLEEKLREVELQREAMKTKHDSDLIKVVKLKDREITKLRGDLARCQDELKEELSKRGMSTSARASFDSERQKLLQEVRDLQLAKRQLEDRLVEAGETEKRLQLEIRRLQDSCKLELSRVEREATLEVKKLLDELKTKDHMLEQMDRSIYPDRATILKNRLEKLSIEEMLNFSSASWSSRSSGRSNSSCSSCSESSCSCITDKSDNNTVSQCDSCSSNASAAANVSSCSCKKNSYSSNNTRSSSCCNRSIGDTSRFGSKIAIRKRSRSASALGRSSQTVSSKTDCSSSSDTSSSHSCSSNNSSVVRPASTTPSTTSRVDECLTSGGCALQTVNLQKKLYEAEKRMKLAEGLQRAVMDKNNALSANSRQLEIKIKSLNQQISDVKLENESNQKEIKRLNDVIVQVKGSKRGDAEIDTSSELEFYRKRCVELDQVLLNLRQESQAKDRRIGLLIKSQLKPRNKYERKTVRFLLPDDMIESKTSDISDSDFSSRTISSCSDPIQSDELLIQSLHKDYEALMEEHLKLQKYCATLLQSQSTNTDAVNKELHVKRESLDIAIQAMEEKLRLAEEREERLKHQLQQVYDQNEELEFRVLELEEFSEKNKPADGHNDEDDLSSSNRQLKSEVEILRLRLAQYERLDILELEKDANSPCNPPDMEVTCIGDHQRLSVENLRKHSASLCDSDEENPMVQSFSTMTSGFDEISELDDRTEMPDMPAEEEAEADDIALEMPTEECDVIPESTLQVKDNSSHLSIQKSETNNLALSSDNVYNDHSEAFDEQLSDRSEKSINIVETVAKIAINQVPVPGELFIYEKTNNTSNDKVHDESLLESAICTLQERCNDKTKCQRVLNLEDQVEILEHVENAYKMTIDTLSHIEQQIQFIIPSEFNKVNTTSNNDNIEQQNDAEKFWSVTSEDIKSNISVLEQEIYELAIPDIDDSYLNDTKVESCDLMRNSCRVLRDTDEGLQEESKTCNRLDKRIERLERQTSCSDKYDSIKEQFETRDDALLSPQPAFQMSAESDNSSLLGSLKRLALNVVAAGFRTEFLELKSLTHDFFAATEEDELKDIAFIDEDDATCIQSDAASAAELEVPSQLQLRTELRLNTKMTTLNQRFDFLSPTSFDNPDWNNSGHLETINHCLLLQMDELERERDSLKDIVCRDDAVINEMTQHISSLENSEQELKKVVCRLVIAEEQAAENIEKLETERQELRTKLRSAESIEASLKTEMESIGKREAEMESRLLRSVESLENTTAKLRSNLSQVEKEKTDAVKQAEELNAMIVSLQQKETSMMQRMKSFECLNQSLKEKNRDLESSLSSAYDEVSGLTRLKDSLIQRVDSLVDENSYLSKENDELLAEKKDIVADVERLTESENFLKEANRKMWLSLQASIEEARETSHRKSCQFCKRTIDDHKTKYERDEPESTSVDSVDITNQDVSVQTDASVIRSDLQRETRPNAIVSLLSTFVYNNNVLRANREVRSASCKGSLETERKAIFEEMLKFVTSTRLRRSANDLNVTSSVTKSQEAIADGKKPEDFGEDVSEMEPVEGEEEFWNVVESYDDIYDVRAADSWNLWRHLEHDIMGLNLDDLRKLVAEREDDKSCQTSFIDLTSPSVERSTQYEPDDEQTTRQSESSCPPLPTSLPPREESVTSCDVISCSEQGTQTELAEKVQKSLTQPEEDIAALRHLLNQNERTLIARKNELDRITVEMRSWQQRALEANDQVSRLSTELSEAQQIIESTRGRTLSKYKTPTSIDCKLQHSTTTMSRMEHPSSQIPVSVKRAVDFYSSISQRSASTSPGPAQSSQRARTISTGSGQPGPTFRTTSQIPRPAPGSPRVEYKQITSTATQGPLSNGSSSSEQQQQQQQDLSTSQIPRLLPDWIQQQQQLREQQSRSDEMSASVHQELGEAVAASSLQQYPAVAADATAAAATTTAAAAETEMPGRLPSDDVTDAHEEGGDF